MDPKRRILLSGVAAIAASAAFTPAEAARSQPDTPIRNAITALGLARSDLENVLHDYCGHRVEALEAVNHAIEQLKRAITCDLR
jgi:hypothetical protein